MLKYLIIPLADNAVSFCHYNRKITKGNLISLDILRDGILWAMKENLSIHFLYPDEEMPEDYLHVIDSIDHATIISSGCKDNSAVNNADVVVFDSWETANIPYTLNDDICYVVRTSMTDLITNKQALINLIIRVNRLVVIITDLEKLSESDFNAYEMVLNELVPVIAKEFERGHAIQFNLLTDRLYLGEMNNCNAGYESLTLAPDGKFYICPAFYLDGSNSVGNINSGLDIKNQQLYRLDYAPICRICDAYQCRRCVWLNNKTTLEVNTPSHEQCVIAHIERNSSKKLLEEIRKQGEFLQDKDIEEISYLDPFENIINK